MQILYHMCILHNGFRNEFGWIPPVARLLPSIVPCHACVHLMSATGIVDDRVASGAGLACSISLSLSKAVAVEQDPF